MISSAMAFFATTTGFCQKPSLVMTSEYECVFFTNFSGSMMSTSRSCSKIIIYICTTNRIHVNGEPKTPIYPLFLAHNGRQQIDHCWKVQGDGRLVNTSDLKSNLKLVTSRADLDNANSTPERLDFDLDLSFKTP